MQPPYNGPYGQPQYGFRVETDIKPSEDLLLEHESAAVGGQSMFERVMLMLMAITTSVASIVFIVISIRAYLFLIEVGNALESWRNQLGSI